MRADARRNGLHDGAADRWEHRVRDGWKVDQCRGCSGREVDLPDLIPPAVSDVKPIGNRGTPEPVQIPRFGERHWGTVYDVSPDGSRVYFPHPGTARAPHEFGVVSGWRALLQR